MIVEREKNGRIKKGNTPGTPFKKGHRITVKHGHRASLSPTYNSWRGLLNRCKYSKTYLEKKIKVCERWQTFEAFFQDMGERPLGKTLDRIDNNGNYEPSNCRWATPKEQSRHLVGKKLPPRTWNTKPKCEKCQHFHSLKKPCQITDI